MEIRGWKTQIGKGRIEYILAFPDLCGEGVLGGFFESHGGIVSDSSFLFLLLLFPVLLTLCLKVNSSPRKPSIVRDQSKYL